MSEATVEQEIETQDAPDDETPELDEPGTTDEPDTDETDDAEPGDEPDEQEPAPEPDQQLMDDKHIEKAYKALAKLREHVARRVGDIFGDDAIHLVTCPLCAETPPGFIWPPNIAPLDENVQNDLRMLLGMNVRGAFRKHPSAEPCETCGGLGRVETPSKVPGYDVVDCPACAASGRILTPNVMPLPVFAGAEPVEAPVTGPTVTTQALPPEAQALRDAGWIVAPPFNPTAPQV